MRILMIGAGSVGAVLARYLENVKGNELTYFVRQGKKAQLQRIKLLDARSGELHVRERPSVVEPSAKLPGVDTVILAVRADQLDATFETIELLGAGVRIATASAGLDDLERLRARFPGRPVAQIVPLFFAYPDGDTVKWWNPPLARTLITDEHDAAGQPLAEELAAALTQGGLPARAVRSLATARDAVVAAGMPVLASFELAGWDWGALQHDASLRALAGRSMREGMQAMIKNPLASRLVGLVPTPLFSAALRAAPSLAPQDLKDMWRVHGPKIAGQTRALLDSIIARADQRGSAPSTQVDGLRELRRRLEKTT